MNQEHYSEQVVCIMFDISHDKSEILMECPYGGIHGSFE